VGAEDVDCVIVLADQLAKPVQAIEALLPVDLRTVLNKLKFGMGLGRPVSISRQ